MNFPSQHQERASVLVIALFTCFAIGLVLAGVLTLVSQRHKLSVRSAAWSSALAVAEAGVEEALSHWHTDLKVPTANGWTATNISGQTAYRKSRTFGDGSYFQVTTYNALSNSPVIFSAGFVPSPLSSNVFISRLIKVATTNPPSMFTGISANNQIILSGNILVDAYDSGIGPYNALTNRNASGKVATNCRLSPAVDINNTTVFGQVVTGPGGVVALSPGGSVGDENWAGTYTGIQTGMTNNNMNVAFPSNAPPVGGPFLAPTVISSGGSNITVLGTVTNQMASFTSSNEKEPMVVTGKATLWVTGDLTLTGNAYIYIAPGASLTLYVGGTTKLGGTGVVNASGKPTNFTYRGLSSSSSITYSGTSDFYGTVNAPQAAFKMNGTAGFYGAIICNSYDSMGTAEFHYDNALGGGTGYLVRGWTEL